MFTGAIRSLLLFIGVSLYSVHAHASSNFTVHIDNDLIYGTDRDYTGGFKFKYTVDKSKVNQMVIKPFEGLFDPFDLQLYADQFELSIEAFTLDKNRTTWGTDIMLNEAWTHVDLRRFYQRTEQKIGVDMVFGWLGSHSPGIDVQNQLHKLIGNGDTKEALHELPNQLTLQLGMDVMTDWFQVDDWQAYHSTWLKLGSPLTQGYVGVGLLRAVNSQPVLMYNQLNHVRSNGQDLGYFYFGSAGMSYLVYSALVDGRLFANDKTLIKRYRWVPMLQYGAGLSYQDFALSLSGNAIGQVYKDQPENVFRFASLTFTWFF